MQDYINQQIADNAGLVYSNLHKLHLAKDPEAESLGYEALYNAAKSFDESKGIKFSTYASVCIYNALGSYLRTLKKKRQLDVISYNNVAYTEDGTEHEFVDFLGASVDTEQEYIQQDLYAAVRLEVQNLYDELSNSKHKAILAAWRRHDYKVPMRVIAAEVGVSQPYVSQVLNSIKAKLHEKLEDRYYD